MALYHSTCCLLELIAGDVDVSFQNERTIDIYLVKEMEVWSHARENIK
jgi:hypothetical protein